MASAPYTSALAESLAPDLLDRFQRYVRVDTQSRPQRTGSPSTPGQLDLARLLVSELHDAGIADAFLDDNGYVVASLDPVGAEPGGPTIGLIAHMDTSPAAPGKGVEPLVHREWDGGIIELPREGTRLDPAAMPELSAKLGHDLVTGSGDTLLGADDKAGVAAIMAAVARLAADPQLPRPHMRIGFTPDEEIGLGASLFDVERFGALCAYTIDGSELGELQDETFSAVEVKLTVHGVDVHPGFATGKLVSALRLAARIVAALPADTLSPETTSGREGFIHPYDISGTPGQAQVTAIVRDFDDEQLERHVALLRRTAEEVVAAEPRASLEFDVRPQYRNMRRHLDAAPYASDAAEEAMRAEGLDPRRVPIRGGTDGSLLSEMGLPTPNIFTGGHEFHSVREWASVQDMAASAATIIRLAEVWTRPQFVAAAASNGR
jgi:tripeptide aminopeptidase